MKRFFVERAISAGLGAFFFVHEANKKKTACRCLPSTLYLALYLPHALSFKEQVKSFLLLFDSINPFSHRNDHFSLSVSFFKIPERFGHFTQLIPSINNRLYLAGFKKLLHINQIFLVCSLQHAAHFLTRGQ